MPKKQKINLSKNFNEKDIIHKLADKVPQINLGN
jgi:hypothetical protein